MNRLPDQELAKFYDNLPFCMPEGKGLLELLETVDLADMSQIQRIVKDIMKNVGYPVLFADNYQCGLIDDVKIVNRNVSEDYELQVHCTQARGGMRKWIRPTSMYALKENPRCAALFLCERNPWNGAQTCTITMPKSDIAIHKPVRELLLEEMRWRGNYSHQ